jgi:ATP-dependent protease ClpP protease subunit
MDQLDSRRLVEVRRELEDRVTAPQGQVEIDLWIESGGGDPHTAYKLALMLRHAASTIRVVVPDYAKSAATLLALVGKPIYMAPGAELGPLDAQMLDEGEGSLRGLSALNIARAADEVARDAIELAVAGGAKLLPVTGLSRAGMLSAMLDFSARMSEPLVRQLDPKIIHQAKELLRVTHRYAERLLASTTKAPDRVAKRLVEEFPTHGCVVSYEDAKELGLPVKPIAEYDLLPVVRKIHRTAEDGHEVVELLCFSEVVNNHRKDDESDSKGTDQGGRHGEHEGHQESVQDTQVTASDNGLQELAIQNL